jgi:hypothetical protein
MNLNDEYDMKHDHERFQQQLDLHDFPPSILPSMVPKHQKVTQNDSAE